MPLEEALAIRRSRLEVVRALLAPWWARHEKITLEIGCGHGHFLTAYAAAHPEELCIGIDLLADRLARAERKSRRAGLANVAWLHAEAGLFLEALPPAPCIETTFVLFPDPWPKRRHEKNRLVQPALLDALADHTLEDGRLFFRTDHAHYFKAARRDVDQHPRWQPPTDEPWPFELATVFQQRAETYHSFAACRCQPAVNVEKQNLNATEPLLR